MPLWDDSGGRQIEKQKWFASIFFFLVHVIFMHVLHMSMHLLCVHEQCCEHLSSFWSSDYLTELIFMSY